jgi:hypothetical protein
MVQKTRQEFAYNCGFTDPVPFHYLGSDTFPSSTARLLTLGFQFKVHSLEQVFYALSNILVQGSMCLTDAEVVQIGHITHFFSKINVAIVELTAPLSVGESILIKGPTTDFEQVVDSMQIEHQNIQTAEAGQSIGLKTAQLVKEKDMVYKKL